MNGLASDAPDANRLALALLLALGLHAALLLGLPAEGWSLRYPPPLRFEVALLPRIDLPPRPEPPMPPAPDPAESASPPSPAATGALSEPAPSAALPMAVTEPAPVSPPAPVMTPPPAPLPPKPVVRTPLAPPKLVIRTRPVVPPSSKSPLVAKMTPTPRPVIKPVAPSPSPLTKSAIAPRTPGESIAKPAQVKPLPASSSASVEARLPPVAKPATRPTEPSRRNSGTGNGKIGRLDSAALLGQIAGLDADTQRQTGGGAREQRVSLADTRSLAGFYAADWARKVSRVGELNFPDAARRMEPGSGPVLEVAIRADGSLREVRVLRSSGSAELDRAARRIVELAAPYPPFSSELRHQIDVLRITAPWRFDPVGRVRVR